MISNLELQEPPAASIGQALLFSPEIELLVVAEEAKGLYTAERLRVQRPDTYKAIAGMIGLGYSLRKIADILSVHQRTAAAVRDAEPETIDAVRSKMVERMRTAIDLQIDRLIDQPENVPMNVAGLLVSQLVDKMELIAGRATQRVESVERVDIYANWQTIVQQHLAPESSGIGLNGGNLPAIEGELVADDEPLSAADTDAESDASASTASERVPEATALDTEAGPAIVHGLAAEQAGGEGGREATGGAETRIDWSP